MLSNLTDIENQVLNGIIRGLNNNEIATELFISIHTVKCHVRDILNKLNAKNRTEAAVIAVRKQQKKTA